MLKPRKSKISKKDIKEDKFVESVLEAKAYVEENYKQVFTIVSSIFAVIVIIMIYSYMRGRSSEAATTLFGKAQVEYQNYNYTKAKELLTTLSDSYGNTEPGQQGRLFLANLYFQENNIERADELFMSFIDSYSGSDILLSSGYAGHAACLESEEAYRDAAENYYKAYKTAPEFVEAANYLYLAGLNYHKAGDTEKATHAFREIESAFPESNRAFDAKSKLILIAKQAL